MSFLLTSFLVAGAGLWLARRGAGGWVLLLLLGLPLGGWLPEVRWAVLEGGGGGTGGGTGGGGGIGWAGLAGGAWLFGAAVSLLFWVRDARALERWREGSEEVRDGRTLGVFREGVEKLCPGRRVGLRRRAGLVSPVVAGIFRPVVFLPESAAGWSGETLRMALWHELGHVRRGDLWLAALARAACAVNWFNPLAWRLRGKVLARCEHECDAWVLRHGADARSYARALCEVAEAALPVPAAALAMAGHVPLRERVAGLGRPVAGRPVLCGALLLLTVAAAFALSSVRFVQRDAGEPEEYTPEEIELRLSADPFPEG